MSQYRKKSQSDVLDQSLRSGCATRISLSRGGGVRMLVSEVYAIYHM